MTLPTADPCSLTNGLAHLHLGPKSFAVMGQAGLIGHATSLRSHFYKNLLIVPFMKVLQAFSDLSSRASELLTSIYALCLLESGQRIHTVPLL
jgi:hypothetical protein